MALLSVKNLTKNYGPIKAVNKISFDVQANEIFALIGPNGAGKSTTLRMIATLLDPTSGSIVLDGIDALKNPAAIREKISYLPEEAGAYKNLSGQQYLTTMAALYTDDSAKQKEYVATATDITNLRDRLRDKIATYSKGMTRKLLLARTVMARPTLAILDEPTSGLDIINALEIRKTIIELAKSGMTVLLSSHNMLEIEFLSHRVGIISDGTIHEIGKSQQLKHKYAVGNLEEVFVKAVQ